MKNRETKHGQWNKRFKNVAKTNDWTIKYTYNRQSVHGKIISRQKSKIIAIFDYCPRILNTLQLYSYFIMVRMGVLRFFLKPWHNERLFVCLFCLIRKLSIIFACLFKLRLLFFCCHSFTILSPSPACDHIKNPAHIHRRIDLVRKYVYTTISPLS